MGKPRDDMEPHSWCYDSSTICKNLVSVQAQERFYQVWPQVSDVVADLGGGGSSEHIL